VASPQKLVILALAERADDGGTCWPSLTHLAEMTGLVRSTVALALIGLEDTRPIVRDRGGSAKSTRYRLLMDGPGVARGVR
jgi:predicted transcriptional regulator